jgi:hypothetical protein
VGGTLIQETPGVRQSYSCVALGLALVSEDNLRSKGSTKRSLTVEKRAYFFNQSVAYFFLQLQLCIVRDLNISIVSRVLSRLSL